MTRVDTNAAERKRRAEEARYRRSSHGRRHQALMAYATAGYGAPMEIYQREVERQVASVQVASGKLASDKEHVINNAEIIDMLKGIQAQLNRIEKRLDGGAAVVAGSGQFAAVALSATIDKGKTYWKVQGGSFMQYGIMIWSEVLAQTDFADADPMQSYDLTGYTAVYAENEDGRKKIISLKKTVVPTPNGNGATDPMDSRPKPRSDAARWRKECETAANAFEFDTAMARLASVFPDADGVAWAREEIWGQWDANKARAYTAGLLAYAQKREELNGSVKKMESHQAGVKAAKAQG